MQSTTLLSPGVENFSTSPTTPTPPEIQIRPSLSRKSSRPSILRIGSNDRDTDVVVDNLPSPDVTMGMQEPKDYISVTSGTLSQNQRSSHMHSVKSPCFIHSHLDKGASLSDWIRSQQRATSLNGNQPKPHPPELDKGRLNVDYDEDEEYSRSLTAQLAETAVSVREMSKQLGRARVHSDIKNVLIVTKARDNRLIQLTRELALYLMLKPRRGGRGLVVYVDSQLSNSKRFDAQGIERDHPCLFAHYPQYRSSSSSNVSTTSSNNSPDDSKHGNQGQLRYWTADMCSHSPHLFDFVVTLGGDGTVLFTSWLFQRIVPPVLPFALGSLGFLTNFDFSDHQPVMDSAIDSGIRVNLRMRFTCTVYRAVAPGEGNWRKAVKKANTGEILMRNLEQNGWEALEGGWSHIQPSEKHGKDKPIMCFTTRPAESFEILNDLVVDRGPSPYVSLLELFGDDHHLTTVQADGLTISTPTGSTAYSLSAGGSLVHPEIPAILITPICPHTLSFRPMLLPDSMELRICVPFNSRSTAWASFDGRGRVELKQGDHIKVTASKYPFPTVCADKQSTDWFHAISRTLKWNERERQKSFVMVEEGPARAKNTKPKRKRSRSATPGAKTKVEQPRNEVAIEDEEEDEATDDDEEDDKFDIDDLSSTEIDDRVSSSGAKEPVDNVSMSVTQTRAELVAASLSRGNPFMTRIPHSKSGVDSGVDSPDRFIGPHPQPPRLSPRHVAFTSSSSSVSDVFSVTGEYGARDDIHSPRSVLSSARSKIPKDRDLDGGNSNTPTLQQMPQRERLGATLGQHVHSQHRGRSREHHHDGQVPPSLHRAFAVWGQDESDSNTSDSDP